MNKQNKIILIGFFFLCIFAVGAGIYLFPKDAPLSSGPDDIPYASRQELAIGRHVGFAGNHLEADGIDHGALHIRNDTHQGG